MSPLTVYLCPCNDTSDQANDRKDWGNTENDEVTAAALKVADSKEPAKRIGQKETQHQANEPSTKDAHDTQEATSQVQLPIVSE